MVLYKYMCAEHLDATLSRGIFRVGTLHSFRNVELHGEQIGDAGEGTIARHLTALEPFTLDLLADDPRAAHARKVIKGWDELPAGSQVRIKMETNSVLELREDSTDVYVYCVTKSFDPIQMERFGYDACLEIIDPNGFFAELSNSLDDADLIGRRDVQYRGRRADFSDESVEHAVFVKPESYAPQQEHRAIWRPHSTPIYPKNIVCPRALMFCKVHRTTPTER